MAAILQLRRGTSTPSLAQSELFFNTTSETLVVGDGSSTHTLVKIGDNTGNINLIGDITASNLLLSGHVTVNGNITFGGSLITLGDENTDDIVFVGELSSSLIPNNDNAFDVGSSSRRYKSVFAVSGSFTEINDVNFTGFVNSVNSFSSSQESKNSTLETYTASVDSRLDLLEGDSGSQDSRISNLELFSSSQESKDSTLSSYTSSVDSKFSTLETYTASIDTKLDTLETYTASIDTKLDTLETYTSSNDDNITELFATASDHESRIDEIEGTFSSSVDSRLDYLEGSFSTSVDDRLDQLEIHSGSTDSRLDNIEGISGSYATTGSNIFLGDEEITGSLKASGSVEFQGIPWPSIGSETHLFKTNGYTVNAPSGDRTYDYFGIALEQLETGSYYENSLLFYTYDNHVSPTYGNELLISPLKSHMRITASGSQTLGNISLSDLLDGTTLANIYGSQLHLGAFLSDTILLGNTGSYINIKASNLYLESALTSSNTIQGTYFYGDGRHLTNVTASYVEYDNVVNKPTLVSGSTQIDVNNTQNFQTFSSSVDSRLDYIEGDFSSSVNSQLDHIHSYTSSLKTAIDVSGQNLTVYGDLTVQGSTTTLNTTELVIEDKLLSLASGSTTSAQADGAGLHISGADASIIWYDTISSLVVNTRLSSSVGFTGDGTELINIQHGNVVFGGSNIVSGSSQVTSSLDARYLEINGDDVVSGSSQITITDTTGFSTFSGSLKDTDDGQDSRLNNLESFSSSQESKDSTLSTLTASYDNRLNNLESFSSSQESKDSTLETYTSSIDSKFGTLGTYTSSVDTKFSTLGTYTSSVDSDLNILHSYTQSVDNKFSTLETYTSSVDSKFGTIETYTQSVDSDLSNLHSYTQSNDTYQSEQDDRLSQIESVTASLDTTYEEIASGTHTLVSGSSQLTASLDFRYLEIGGDSVISGSDQVTSSLDLRYEVSGSVAQLVGIHSISGSLGSAAWYNVSASIADGNPAVLGNAGAVKDYIDQRMIEIGAGDITEVIAGNGMSGGALSGSATLTLDTASAHFNEGVQNNLISLNLFTESLDVTYVTQTELGDATGSLINSIATKLDTGSYLLDSASIDNRLDTLEGTPFENPLTFSDTTTINFTRVTDTITADVIGGVVSGSDQINTLIVGTSYSSSVDSRLDLLESFSSSLDASFVTQTELASATGALESYNDTQDGRLNNLESFSSSQESKDSTLSTYTSSIDTKLGTLGTYTSSVDTKFSNLGTYTSSIDTKFGTLSSYTQSNDTTNSTQNSRLDQLSVVSGSNIGRLNNLELYTQSNDTAQGVQDGRLSNLETYTSSIAPSLYEEKASGTHTLVSGSSQLTSDYDSRYLNLTGDETVGGTVTFTDIVVNGTGSFAYITSVTGSAKIIGDNYIVLNNDTPTQRFAGMAVYDSGSAGTTASLEFDGQTNDWFYEYSSDGGVTTDHGVVIFGPEYSTKGSPTYLTNNKIPKSVGSHHLNDSNITDSGTLITLGSNSVVSGTFYATGTTLVSGSSQINAANTSNWSTNFKTQLNVNAVVSGSAQIVPLLPLGTVSGSSQVNADTITNFDTNVKDKMNADGVISGSSQLTTEFDTRYLNTLGDSVVSGSSQININSTSGTLTTLGTVTSGNVTQILPIGTVSGSSQISIASTSGFGTYINQPLLTTSTVQFGKVGVGGAADATYELKVAGDIGATGDVVAYISSDRRLKDEITPIENSLQKINSIGGYSFVWNENQHIYKGKDYGVIAQEIENILPELVETRDNGYKAVKYDRLVSLLIEGIKDLSKEVQDLKEKINRG